LQIDGKSNGSSPAEKVSGIEFPILPCGMKPLPQADHPGHALTNSRFVRSKFQRRKIVAKQTQFSQEKLELGYEVLKEIASFRPYTSISFQASEKIMAAMEESSRLAEEGMAKNKHKMKKTVRNILESIATVEPGEPVNLNLTKYERKSVKTLAKLTRRVLKDQKDGISAA
jgi:hypothetical protein